MARPQSAGRWIPGFPLDLSRALRSLRRRPLFVAIVLLTLGLGIGADVAVFSVVYALLIRPLPYAAPDRLVALWPDRALANQELADLRRASRSYSDIAAFSPGWLLALTGQGTPEQLNGARVSGNMFRMLGVSPLVGRTFGTEADTPGNDRVVVLGYRVWQTAFHGDTAVIGRSIHLDRTDYTVVGVMPSGFRMFDVASDLWFPLPMDREAMTWSGATALLYGRLRPGTTLAGAAAEFPLLARSLQRDFHHPSDWAVGATVTGLRESLVGSLRTTLLVLFGAAGLVLLIATANVAILLLVRATERDQELALRASLGATRLRLAALLLGESLVLGLAGGVLGLGLAYGGVGLLRDFLPRDLPRLGEIGVYGPVLVMAAGLTLLTALLFGIGPGLRASRAGAPWLRQGRAVVQGGRRSRGLIVATAVALALVLSVGAALMIRSLVRLTRVDPGFRSDHVLTLRLQPTGYDDAASLRAYWHEVLGRVQSLPGVRSAGTILHLPLSGRSWHGDVQVEGRELPPGAAPPRTAWEVVSPGALATLGVPLLAGRGFGPDDQADAPLAVMVNQAFVRRVFPGQNPLGRRIQAGNATGGRWAEVVAVVGDMRHDGLSLPVEPEIYLPFSQRIVWGNSLVVRTSTAPAALASAIRERIWSVNPDVPISNVLTMRELVSSNLEHRRMVLLLLGLFALVGLMLAAIGLYGIVAYGARRRAREIGIRVALGATRARVVNLVAGEGLGYTALGIAAGVGAALGLSRVMRSLVYGIPATDPVSFVIVPVLLLLVALGACALPAHRAARTDPTEALRQE